MAATRMGANGPDGAVAQVPVTGVIAVAFDHFDSRAGDPQLHTHVVVANKVQTAIDGKWRSLDGRPVHAAMWRCLSTTTPPWPTTSPALWASPGRSGSGARVAILRGRSPASLTSFEVFSSRSQAIEVAADQLIADYVTTHGRQPTRRTVIRLRQQATLTDRPDKVMRSLADLREDWRTLATAVLGKPSEQ